MMSPAIARLPREGEARDAHSERRGHRASDPIDGDAHAAELDEARASHNGVLVVAVAVHLDPDGREAAPTTPAVSRAIRKDRVNARVYVARNCVTGHMQA
jgi:hypothetical protein